ncbi:MAG: c-type cytochrome domain-containing protein [Phycisphaerales bacterium]
MLDVHGMLTLGDGDVAGALWQTGGRLHPVLVHFPIALVALAAGAEVLSAVAGRRCGAVRGLGMMVRGPSALARGCLVVGAPAAGITAWSGWLNAMHEHGGGGPLEIEGHRWVGIAAAAVALMAMGSVLAASWRLTETGMRVYRALVVLAAMLMGAAGHMGGSLVYGGDYLFSPLRAALGWERAETHASTTRVPPEDAGPPVNFATEVWPILESTCIDCHGDVRKRGQLRLDSLAAALKGGKTGPGVVKGDPGASHVIRRVKGLDGKVIMPEDADPLTPEQIEVLERWVRQGAVWPETLGAADTDVEERHWAYEPLAEVKGAGGAGVIDRSIGARLSAEGVSPAERAEPGVLLRRLSLDMTGLPPTTKELDAFDAQPAGEPWSKTEAAAIEEWIVAAGEVSEDHPKLAAPRDQNGGRPGSEGTRRSGLG